jgi:1,4-dihydroxy-2-naphthoate octaprenyltransferase
MGGIVAFENGFARWEVLLLAIVTTLFLQILSNLANDYGDFVKGTDNDMRLGPKRSMQSGSINRQSMKKAIKLFVFLSLVSGFLLVYVSFGKENIFKSLLFIAIGITAILSAIRYTIGDSAYGYSGWGDVFVFIFFGWVAVIGSYFLISLEISTLVFYPATTMGLFSTAVLNLNNLRDYKNDRASGKKTLIVKIGFKNGKIYQLFLILLAWLSFLLYLLLKDAPPFAYLEFLALPLFIRNIVLVFKVKDEQLLDPELKNLALSIILFTILFGIGVFI